MRHSLPVGVSRGCRRVLGGIVRWRSFVAVGDSFTEGLDDPYPDGEGYRGWADLVASYLAGLCRAHGSAPFRYANLAVRGKLFDAIVEDQVPAALRMRPDLFSFAGGGNDVLRPGFDPAAMLGRFDEVIAAMRATGADVIVFRWADITSQLPGRWLIFPRMQFLNQAVGEVARRHGARMVDLWHDPAFDNPRLWSEDRLHLSTAGHRRVAGHVLTALEMAPDPAWLAAPQPPAARGWLETRVRDVRWASQHLVPWVGRRLAGRSSGDNRSAKRPVLAPVLDVD